jgi:hypothetical protein
MSATPRIQRKIVKYSLLFKVLGIISEQEFKTMTNIDQAHSQR